MNAGQGAQVASEPSADETARAIMALLPEYNSAKLHLMSLETQLYALAKRHGVAILPLAA